MLADLANVKGQIKGVSVLFFWLYASYRFGKLLQCLWSVLSYTCLPRVYSDLDTLESAYSQ